MIDRPHGLAGKYQRANSVPVLRAAVTEMPVFTLVMEDDGAVEVTPAVLASVSG